MTIILQYITNYIIYLKFIQCYMSDIFEIKHKQMTPFQAKQSHFVLLSEIWHCDLNSCWEVRKFKHIYYWKEESPLSRHMKILEAYVVPIKIEGPLSVALNLITDLYRHACTASWRETALKPSFSKAIFANTVSLMCRVQLCHGFTVISLWEFVIS